MRKPIIKKGDKYNKLTAIEFHHYNKWNKPRWLFKCDCGVEKVINVSDVKNGRTKACGCLKLIHGMTGTQTYKSWKAMTQRCLNPNNPDWKHYGGRGIKVCHYWLGKDGFINFFKDMGNRPKNKSLDRMNNNGNYTPKNCEWATRKQQSNNTRQNKFITYKGKTKTIAQWSEKLGINYGTLYSRVKNNNLLIK